ncbi:hypothetical protein ACJJTC_015668 [Scirpophaga incertulas]
MESEIIVEGFKNSINMHNLIYGKLISDGDSSTYSKILQARPYSDLTVEKIECYAAAVAFNDKRTISKLYKSISKGDSPRGKIKLLENRRINKNAKHKAHRKPKRRIMFAEKSKEDHNYGQDCKKPDIPKHVFDRFKEIFLENLKKTEEERRLIERKTVLQSNCSEWLELRRSLLTASNFGKVVTRRNDVSCHNMIKELLYKSKIDHISAIKHGKDSEKIAIKQLETQEKIKIEPCGLFIDEEIPFLGATPDGLSSNDHDTIIEIKCPLTAYKIGLEDAIKNRKVTFWKDTKHGLQINKNHQWYYQIQGQLHVTKRSKCLFAVWSNENSPLKTEIIKRDDIFWKEKMEKKLTTFYLHCILPELIDPRFPRGMNIRNPSYIEDAMRSKKSSKENIEPELSNDVEITPRTQLLSDVDKNSVRDESTDINMPTCTRYLDFMDM